MRLICTKVGVSVWEGCTMTATTRASVGMVDARLLGQLLPRVGPADEDAAGSPPAGELHLASVVDAVERRTIMRALHGCDDNKAEAARLLGVSERTLWYKLLW